MFPRQFSRSFNLTPISPLIHPFMSAIMRDQGLRPRGGKSQLPLNNFSDLTNKANVHRHRGPRSPFNSCLTHEYTSDTHIHIPHPRPTHTHTDYYNQANDLLNGTTGTLLLRLQAEAPLGPQERLRGNYNKCVCGCVLCACMRKISLIYNQGSFDLDWMLKKDIDTNIMSVQCRCTLLL